MVSLTGRSSPADLAQQTTQGTQSERDVEPQAERNGELSSIPFEKSFSEIGDEIYMEMSPKSPMPLIRQISALFSKNGKLRPFRLLRQDICNIRKRYVSDWTLFNQLVVASAVYVFFTNILPGITFASDLYVLTGMTWGTIEVIFSTGLCGMVFALFSSQPLTILGVTGPFSVLAENIYSLCTNSFQIDFLQVMAWSLIHSGWMHYVLAIFNAHDWTMQYVTTFSADIFSLLNSVIYFHKAVQELQRNHEAVSFASFLYSIIGAVGTFLVAVFLSTANSWKPLFHRYIRMGLTEYAAAISIILFIGMPHLGELASLDQQRLAVQTSFRPTSPERNVFFVRFWELPVSWIFISMIPGAIITVLFFFDHEISTIICTIDRYGTKKPYGFAWDIALLGTSTALCGILGLPPANGLIPQAPLHSESLLHVEKEEFISTNPDGEPVTEVRVANRVYEQRWSPFLQAGGILLFISPPFQRVLGLTPTSVLAGLFIFMGEQSLAVNPILRRFSYILTAPSELPPLPKGIKSYRGIHMFTLLQIFITGVIFYVTLTQGAPAFPVIIIALVPARLLVMKKLWNRETLRFVDKWACKDGTPEDGEDRRNGVMLEDEKTKGDRNRGEGASGDHRV